jgi:photosystem II stability/assembly factor-like uncharacterized protein
MRNPKIILILILFTGSLFIQNCKPEKNIHVWRRIDPDSLNCHPSNFYFFNPDSGIVFGRLLNSQPYTMSTSDGGKTWSYKDYPFDYPENFGIIDFDVVNRNHIYGYSRNMLLVSYDYCQSWNIVDSLLPIRLKSLKMLDDSIGFIGGIDGHIYKTQDGGISWKTVYSNSGLVNRIISIDKTLYATFIVSTYYGGLIVRSDDMGEKWYEVLRSDQTLLQIGFLSKDYGMAIFLEHEIRITPDGGNTWQMINNNLFAVSQLNDIDFIDNQDAYLISQPFVMHTKDGGKKWEMVLSDSGGNFSKIQMLSKDCGYTVDYIKGYIYKLGN